MRLGNQKLKLCYLERILREQTDESHSLSVSQLIGRLADYGIPVERKTLYADIEALKLMGLDVNTIKGRGNRYALISREFELPELRLLVDAVQSSKFISEKKSRALIKKLEKLTSVHEARRLDRQVYIRSRVKGSNECVYYSIDAINVAISDGKKIRFKYFEYATDKQKRLKNNGNFYEVSPYVMLWDDEYYYLVCNYDVREGVSHFRVDKMSEVEVLEERSEPRPSGFEPSSYAKQVFGMFAGEECRATLRFDNSLIGVVIDRFGSDITVQGQGGFFVTRVNIVPSPIFFGWIFQLGSKAEILGPPKLRQDMREYIHDAASKYE